MLRTSAISLLVAVLASGFPRAQAPLAFEAASVKLNKSGAFFREIGPTPGGRFAATNIPPRDLIAYAYGVPQDSATIRILGAPKWLDDERYDVRATVTGAWTIDQMREMVRTMLVDRFTLAAHRSLFGTRARHARDGRRGTLPSSSCSRCGRLDTSVRC